MATIVVSVTQDNLRVAAVEKLLRDKYPGADVSVRKEKQAASRAERFSETQGLVEDAKSEAEELRDELQNWLDGLPENLQGGGKADELQPAIDELETFVNACDEATSASPDFPGMY